MRSAWTRALNETRGAANMSGGHPTDEVETLARDLCVRALSALSIEGRERVMESLRHRYLPAAAAGSATGASVATARNRVNGA